MRPYGSRRENSENGGDKGRNAPSKIGYDFENKALKRKIRRKWKSRARQAAIKEIERIILNETN